MLLKDLPCQLPGRILQGRHFFLIRLRRQAAPILRLRGGKAGENEGWGDMEVGGGIWGSTLDPRSGWRWRLGLELDWGLGWDRGWGAGEVEARSRCATVSTPTRAITPATTPTTTPATSPATSPAITPATTPTTAQLPTPTSSCATTPASAPTAAPATLSPPLPTLPSHTCSSGRCIEIMIAWMGSAPADNSPQGYERVRNPLSWGRKRWGMGTHIPRSRCELGRGGTRHRLHLAERKTRADQKVPPKSSREFPGGRRSLVCIQSRRPANTCSVQEGVAQDTAPPLASPSATCDTPNR